MNITQVTVGWQETVSLPEYNNVRPSLTLTAQVNEEEDEQATVNALLDEVKRVVHQQVDEALERCGRRPRYYTGPTYQVVECFERRLVLVIPNEVELKPQFGRGGGWSHVFGIERGLSRAGAMKAALRCAAQNDWTMMVTEDIGDAMRQLVDSQMGLNLESDDPKTEDEIAF